MLRSIPTTGPPLTDIKETKELLDAYRVKGIGMAWYTFESWEQLRAVADDRDELGTFAEFERNAARLTREFEARGFAVEKILANIADLAIWCRREGCRNDQRARSAYGAMLLAARGSTSG